MSPTKEAMQEYKQKLRTVQRLLDLDAPSTKLYQLSMEEIQALRYAMLALEAVEKNNAELTELRRHEKDQIRAGNLYHSYRCGYKDSARGKSYDKVFETHPNAEMRAEYSQGYRDAQTDRRASLARAEERSGYVPTILRAMGLAHEGEEARLALEAQEQTEDSGPRGPEPE